MATIAAHLDTPADSFPLSPMQALREAQFLTRYALDGLDGSEHPGVASHARGAAAQLDGSIAADRLPRPPGGVAESSKSGG